MELHHDKHHRKYVEGANAAITELLEARRSLKFDELPSLERRLAFNVSGHVLHSIFWQNLSPDGGGEPEGELALAVRRDFGTFEAFRRQLTAAAGSIMGSGWACLVWDPVSGRLGTSQIHDHQSEVTQGSVPPLVLDAWEHAYYLQVQTDKDQYFEAIWNLWNWEDVSRRFEFAQRLDLALTGVADGVPPVQRAPAALTH